MKECLIDVLNARDTVLHVFPVVLEDENGTPKAADFEQEALRLAASVQIVPEEEAPGLHARPHVSRGGQFMPYNDVLEARRKMLEQAERRIYERAYFLWQNEGCPANRAAEHWHLSREIERNDGSISHSDALC